MKHTVLGKKAVSFTAADGKVIEGTTLFVAYDDDNVIGMAADKIFISAAKMPKGGIEVGSDIDIYFNRFGKVDSIIVN